MNALWAWYLPEMLHKKAVAFSCWKGFSLLCSRLLSLKHYSSWKKYSGILFKKHHVIIWETFLWVQGCDVNSPQYRWLAVYEYQCDGWRRVFIYVSIYRCRECKLGSRGVHWYWAGGRRREQVCVCPSVSLV